MLGQHFLLWHIAWNLAHAVQIIRKTDHFGRNVRNNFECTPDHCRAQNLAKGADMRQTRWTIAGFEQDISLFGRLVFIPFEQCARLYKGPSLRRHRRFSQIAHGLSHILRGVIMSAAARSPYCETDKASING